MTELLTRDECVRYFRDEVATAGGAKKWLRKNKVFGCEHILHLIEN